MVNEMSSPTFHVPDGMTEEQARIGANKLYLVLIEFEELEDGAPKTWMYCRGRETAYNYIRDVILEAYETEEISINFDNSFIIVSTVPIDTEYHIQDFMRKVIESGQVEDKTGFDIHDYYDFSDPEEQDVNKEPVRYGNGENTQPYDAQNAVEGGEV